MLSCLGLWLRREYRRSAYPMLPIIQPIDPKDKSDLFQRLFDLNNQHAIELSWLDEGRFRHLLSQAFYRCHIGNGAGFLLAFDQSANYDSSNFLYFRNRFSKFIYVDRIVIGQEARGKGYARAFYEDLFACARKAGHDQILCEVNINPPNPGSDAFRAEMGFSEVGQATTLDGKKTVRYMRRSLV